MQLIIKKDSKEINLQNMTRITMKNGAFSTSMNLLPANNNTVKSLAILLAKPNTHQHAWVSQTKSA